MSATISEWLMAAEYIAAGGNHNIILCERGIRTFETAYRNVLDVTAIAVMKRETHLPVIVDPSHAGGKAWMVPALSCAAVAAGADGLLIEVHPMPDGGVVRRRPGAHAGRVRRADAAAPGDRPRGRPRDVSRTVGCGLPAALAMGIDPVPLLRVPGRGRCLRKHIGSVSSVHSGRDYCRLNSWSTESCNDADFFPTRSWV